MTQKIGVVINTCFAAINVAMATGAITAEAMPTPAARGIVVLRATIPVVNRIHSFGLEISVDGQTFVDAQVGPTRGLRLDRAILPRNMGHDKIVLMLPVVASFNLTPKGFLFDGAGTYYLRWNVALEGKSPERLKFDQEVQVRPARPDDLKFLATLGNRAFATKMLQTDPPPTMDNESIALGVIGEMLEFALSDPSDDAHLDGGLTRANGLLALANELPECSFAGYAAYYAAGIYLTHFAQLPRSSEFDATRRGHPLFSRASDALRFVSNRGDAFLRPRALCALSNLRLSVGDWDEAENYLVQAVEQSEGQTIVEEFIAKMRRDLEVERAKQNAVPKVSPEEQGCILIATVDNDVGDGIAPKFDAIVTARLEKILIEAGFRVLDQANVDRMMAYDAQTQIRRGEIAEWVRRVRGIPGELLVLAQVQVFPMRANEVAGRMRQLCEFSIDLEVIRVQTGEVILSDVFPNWASEHIIRSDCGRAAILEAIASYGPEILKAIRGLRKD